MVNNVKILEFRDIATDGQGREYVGHLVPLEINQDIPFEIERIYYITDVPENITRGFHSHRALEQVLICVHGEVTIKVRTPYEEDDIVLNKINRGLYIGPMVWREMYDFSPGAVLLVLASKHYDEKDYIRDYGRYCELAEKYFIEVKKDDNGTI